MPPAARYGLVAVAIATAVLAIASPPAVADTSSCSAPTLTQPFSPWGDYNWYALAPGQTPGNFDGSGWWLGNGAQLARTTIYGGATATVLNLPSGAWAVSPTMCVAANYPTARTMVREVGGSRAVTLLVSYLNSWGGWTDPAAVGSVTGTSGWAPSPPVQINPPNTSGWTLARFRFVAGWTAGSSQLYDFYVDPYGRG
jgi:hypothetical protein